MKFDLNCCCTTDKLQRQRVLHSGIDLTWEVISEPNLSQKLMKDLQMVIIRNHLGIKRKWVKNASIKSV